MSVRSSDDRIYNYALKHDTEVIKQQTDKRRDRMLSKQHEAQVELANLEIKAKVVIGEFGVPTYTYPAYLNFVRESWKKRKRFQGQTLSKEVMVIEDKWVARELKREVLEQLRKDTLAIPDVI
jgi:L-amino acid N-acyltransferase YncA